MRNYLSILVAIFFFNISVAAPSSKTTKKIEIKNITTQPLVENDEKWFYKEFVHGFMSVYKNKTLIITEGGKPKLLGPTHIKAKEKWLQETAKEEFNDYVLAGKENYKALKLKYKGKPVGAILYRLIQEKEEAIYLAQLFISPAFQHQGIATHVIEKILPKLHPDYKRYEVLTRHQNEVAMLLYNKLEFLIGDISLVQKYDYNPLYYVGFYKVK
jgi:ribosomal protein S18 acetylase RimI-like enzyme